MPRNAEKESGLSRALIEVTMTGPTLPDAKYETPYIPRGGLVIRYARKLRGYAQNEYAAKFGVAVNTLSNYERGETEPSFSIVMSILQDLNVDLVEAYQHVRRENHPDNKTSKRRAA